MNQITCQNCKKDVLPNANGTCPNCQAEILKVKAREADEFFTSKELPLPPAPPICPRCSNPAAVPANVLAYNYVYETGTTILFGVLGQVFRFLLVGSAATSLLPIVTCKRCHNNSTLFKTMEWISRGLGIILTFVLIVVNSTPTLPLIKRGFGLILLCLSPLVIGAVLALVFRSLSDSSKGITFTQSVGKINWFRVRSAAWLREFTRLRDILTNEELEIEQNPYVVNFYKASHAAWKNGTLDGLGNFKTSADAMQPEDFIKKYPPYPGTALRAFFTNFRPLEGEFLVGIGDNHWLVLTNFRLIQRDGRTNEFREVSLADIEIFEIQGKEPDRLVFRMRSGSEIIFEKPLHYPTKISIQWLITQKIGWQV